MQDQSPEFSHPEASPEPTPEPFVPDPALQGPPAAAVEPFAPPSDAWRRVSPKLTTVKRIATSITMAIITLPVAVGLWLVIPADQPLRWVAVACLVIGFVWWLWLWFRARRYVATLGWARRENDLCVVSGLMFRSLNVIPFGRLQVAKVSSGPLQRAFGLSTVELVTAGPSLTVPGLPADEAAALRDLLIELSDAEGSGL